MGNQFYSEKRSLDPNSANNNSLWSAFSFRYSGEPGGSGGEDLVTGLGAPYGLALDLSGRPE